MNSTLGVEAVGLERMGNSLGIGLAPALAEVEGNEVGRTAAAHMVTVARSMAAILRSCLWCCSYLCMSCSYGCEGSCLGCCWR